ncbi:MAG: LysR family transcriptional regulator [Myxococcaceae bacterium]|nr:LysR family transcriptional regulator [Myxococcaceae bacterium]
MEWLNYHHLLYFFLTAREGGLGPAAKILRVSHPTISTQIKLLEDRLGTALFEKRGRRLSLTEEGRVVYRYAEEIFGLGRELVDAVKGLPSDRPQVLTVGVSDVVPKLITRRLLAPIMQGGKFRIVCHEDVPERLLPQLAVHELDLVISDAPVPPSVAVKAYGHLLGSTGVVWAATPTMARSLRRGFPQSLTDVPVVLPTAATSLRRALDAWCEAKKVRPRVVAEAEDSALLKTFAESGWGAVAIPAAVLADVKSQFGLDSIGVADGVEERFYAITVERRLKHSGVIALLEAAPRLLEASKA